MNFLIKLRFNSFSPKYLFAIWIIFVFHSCFLLETDLGKNLQHRMTASCSVNPSGCGVTPKTIANIIQTLSPEIQLQENSVNYESNSSIDFGGILQGTSSTKTISIQNLGTAELTLTSSPSVIITGTDAVMFTITQPSSTTIPAGANITFTVTFTPTSTGSKTASISIANDDFDENNYIINLVGTSSEQLSPEINLQENNTNYASNSNFDFGAITQGSNSIRTFTIQNLGTAALNLTGTPIVSVTGTDAAMFAITQPTANSIANGANTTFAITFNPSSIGAKTASITITNNDSDESSYVINLTGTSNTPLTPEINIQENNVSYASNTSFNFGGVVQGNSTLRIFTIQNLGTAALNLTGNPTVSVTGTDAAMFTITQPTANSIATGANITFVVTFNPSSIGTKSASLTITNNDSDESSYVINLTGTSNSPPLIPEIDIQENNISYAINANFNFGSVAQGFSSERTFTIRNLGTSPLNLTGTPIIALTGIDIGMFSVSQPSVTSLNSGANTTFTIIFNPASLGTKTATITIPNNDSDESSYVINLTATGILPAPEINLTESGTNIAANGNFNFGTVNLPGVTNIQRTFTIQNTGTASLSLTGSNIVEVTGTEFTVSQQPTQSEVGAGLSVDFVVTFTPPSLGDYSAVLKISNDDSDENPYFINIQGTANVIQAPEISIEEDKIEFVTGSLYNFGSVAANGTNSIDKLFGIFNKGNSDLNLTGTPIVVISGTDASMFIITQPEISTIASQGLPVTFTIEFKPDNGSFGTKTATISISNNDSDENPYTINLTGNAQGL